MEKLEAIFSTIFYQTIPFSSASEDFERSPLSSTQLMAPVLGYHPRIMDQSLAGLKISEKLEIDLSEISSIQNDDQSNILSAFDPTTQVEGCLLMYKGYSVYNQLEKAYLQAVNKVTCLYNLLEHNSSRAERGVVEVVQIDESTARKIDMPHTVIDDYQEFSSDKKEAEEEDLVFDEESKDEKSQGSQKGADDPFVNLYSRERFEKMKKKDQISESPGKVKKLVVVIARGELLMAVVLHVVFKYYGGEYDPLYVERVKQTLFMLYDEKLTNIIDQNFNDQALSTPYHSAKLMNSAPPMHTRVPKKHSSKKGLEGSKEASHPPSKNIYDQPRVSLIRSSDLLSHDIVQNKSGNLNLNENSSIADNSYGMDEEEKVSMNMTMKAPLDSRDLDSRGRNSNSVGRQSRNNIPPMKRSNSASRGSRDASRSRGAGDLMRVNPISLPLSKGKLYHYLFMNSSNGQNLNPPIKASPDWFGQVYKEIFRSYCYLHPILDIKDIFSQEESAHPSEKIREALISDPQNGNEYIFEDIMACIREYDVESSSMLDQQDQFSSLNKLLKIKEIGYQIKVPVQNVFSQNESSNFWVVTSCQGVNAKTENENMLVQYEEEDNNDEQDHTVSFTVSHSSTI